MSLLKNLTSDSTIAGEKDSLGGSRVLNSGLYLFTITLAYIQVATSGALGLVLGLKAPGGEVRQTLWMSSGKDKGGKNYYEKDGEKHYLPGYLLANSLALLTTGKEISELDTEKKVVKVYSAEAKGEVPTQVDMITDLLGKEILGGLVKQLVDKTKKNETTGKYDPTGETREENELDKFFRARDRMTVAEIRGQATEAGFAASWEAKWTGLTRDKSTKKSGAGTPGSPLAGGRGGALASGAAGKPQTQPSSLFA